VAETESERRYLTTHEVAALRRMSRDALAHERSEGTGPPWIKDRGRVLYPAAELDEYLERCAAGGLPNARELAWLAERVLAGHELAAELERMIEPPEELEA